MVIIHAFILLFVILLVVTVFTLTAKGAFPYFWAMIGCFVSIVVASGVLAIMLPFPSAGQAILAMGGAMIYTIFLIWDMAVVSHGFDTDAWVLASVVLYLDSLNIFLFLLRFLGGRSSE